MLEDVEFTEEAEKEITQEELVRNMLEAEGLTYSKEGLEHFISSLNQELHSCKFIEKMIDDGELEKVFGIAVRRREITNLSLLRGNEQRRFESDEKLSMHSRLIDWLYSQKSYRPHLESLIKTLTEELESLKV